MSVQLGKFELPKRLLTDNETKTEKYTKFIIEPFERGYGNTLGNSMRRVLLSSLEGAAITAVKIEGAMHEFTTVKGVVEDVAHIILNLKQVIIKSHTREPKKAEIRVNKAGVITAADIVVDNTMEIINTDLVICTLDEDIDLSMEFFIETGRGFRPADNNKKDSYPIGTIAIDSLFSPVTKVNYDVEETRVGQVINYDRLILEVTTDGRFSPEEAVKQSAGILQNHLDVFVKYEDNYVEFEQKGEETSDEDDEKGSLKKLLNMPITEIELSVRAANCINSAEIKTISELVRRTESELLKYRNFGKKSLNEIKAIIETMGLYLGMNVDEILNDK